MFFAFLLLTAGSISGWGAAALPGSVSWPAKFGAGSLVLFFLISAAGWSGLLIPGVLWIILGIGMLLWVRPGRLSIPKGGLYIAVCGMLLMPLVLLPPVSRDAMIHHLYQARMWLEAGRIVRPEWSGFFSYPYLTESFYALAGGTFGFKLSRVVSLLGFLASCSVITGYFLRKGRRRAAILSLAILLSIPELFRNASWSYSDSFLIFFALLAYVEMLRKDGNPVLAVLWAGGASCCKYNGFLVLVSVCLLLPLYFRNMSRKTLIISACAAIFTTAWWALPNILQWGNPVYPLFRGLLGPEYHISARASEYFATGSYSTTLKGITDYLLLPIRMSLHGEWNNPALFDGASGPLLLAGTIIAVPVLSNRRRKFLLPLLYIVLTLISKGEAIRVRYLLPGFAMLAIPVSEAMYKLLTGASRTVKYATGLLIGVCLVWSADRITDLYAYEMPWRESSTYLSEKAPYYDFFLECERFITPEDTTLLVNLGKPFYYPGYAIFDVRSAPLELMEMLWAGMEPVEIVDSLKIRGISHLAVDMFITSINVSPELSEDELRQWRKFVSLHLNPLFTLDNYILFEIRTDNS
ncbi:hypothetical protein DRQ25_02360 [Candidatus Fermentibacteria bacterium]|nr:MAG: hypothetical protein DRQ25_02360 [Candidatus Fermentibacteria bacterium]